MYLDDGYGMTHNLEEFKKVSDFVKQSLLDAGFLINEDKSIINPVRIFEWLGSFGIAAPLHCQFPIEEYMIFCLL